MGKWGRGSNSSNKPSRGDDWTEVESLPCRKNCLMRHFRSSNKIFYFSEKSPRILVSSQRKIARFEYVGGEGQNFIFYHFTIKSVRFPMSRCNEESLDAFSWFSVNPLRPSFLKQRTQLKPKVVSLQNSEQLTKKGRHRGFFPFHFK